MSKKSVEFPKPLRFLQQPSALAAFGQDLRKSFNPKMKDCVYKTLGNHYNFQSNIPIKNKPASQQFSPVFLRVLNRRNPSVFSDCLLCAGFLSEGVLENHYMSIVICLHLSAIIL